MKTALSTLLLAATALGLSACASTTSDTGALAMSARHQHPRDAKQGFPASTLAPDVAARKPLHDHREMK